MKKKLQVNSPEYRSLVSSLLGKEVKFENLPEIKIPQSPTTKFHTTKDLVPSNKLTGNKDVDIIIINMLNDYELGQVCQANRYVNSICNDEKFWRIRTYEKYGNKLKAFDVDVNTYKSNSWQEYYKLLSKVVQKVSTTGYKKVGVMGGPRNVLQLEKTSKDWDTVKNYKYVLIGNTVDEDEGIGNVFNRSYMKDVEKQGYAFTNVGDILISAQNRKDLLALAFSTEH